MIRLCKLGPIPSDKCWGDCTHTDKEHAIVCVYNGYRGFHVCSVRCAKQNRPKPAQSAPSPEAPR